MSLGFRSHTSSTGFNVRLNRALELGPNIISTDEFEHAVLSKVSRYRVIMLVLQYLESEVANIGDVDMFVQEEESFGVYGPSFGEVIEMKGSNGVRSK